MTLRLAGLVVGLLLAGIGILGRRRGNFSRGDLLLWLSFGLAISLLSVVPGTADALLDVLRLENRLFAVLVVSTGALTILTLRQRTRFHRLEAKFGNLVRNLAVRDFGVEATSGNGQPTVGIVIAAFNEEQAIGGVLNELPETIGDFAVDAIVVVDGGEDDTEGVVRRAGYSVATHPVNRGQGDALRTGFAIALRRGDEIIVTMDADGQHAPEELPLLIDPIAADEADYVQGSRFLGEYDDAGGARHFGIRMFTKLINLLAGTEITDCTNGYRAIKAKQLARLRLEEDRFSAAEIIMEGAAKKLRMKEVPVHIRTRSHGVSRKPPRLGYPLGFLRVVVSVWLR